MKSNKMKIIFLGWCELTNDKELSFYLMADRIMNVGECRKTLKNVLLRLVNPNYIYC